MDVPGTVENVCNPYVTVSFDVTLNDVTGTVPVLIGTQEVTSLVAGASTSLIYSWNSTGANIGSHTLEGSHTLADDNDTNDAATTTVTVNEPTAEVTVTKMEPNTMQAGDIITVTITGTNFAPGADVTFENGGGPAPTASIIVFVNANTIRATITAKSGGPPRNRVWDVRLTKPDPSPAVLEAAFTVTPCVPPG